MLFKLLACYNSDIFCMILFFTSLAHLGQKLQDYVNTLPKVKLIRSPKRVGLTQARLIGADNAVGDVLIVLDSHCEATDGWIEPLLARLKENPRVAVVPDIEVIYWEDFSYSKAKNIVTMYRGIFDWNLICLLYTSPSPRDKRQSRMPSSA